MAQTREPAEVIVVLRPEDRASLAVATLYLPPVRTVISSAAGAVAAYNAGCDAATSPLIAITDDDAVPRPDWLERIGRRFASSWSIGAVGGRDVVHTDGGVEAGQTAIVGRICWWGRLVGRHHLEAPLQDVHFLKGVNLAFRRTAWLPIDSRLRGAGAQVALDLEATWSVHRRGWRVVYDPDVTVDHFPAERHDDDGRAHRSLQAEANAVHNEMLAVLTHAEAWRCVTFFAYQMLLGTRNLPGLIMALGQPQSLRRSLTLACGRMSSIKSLLQRP